MAKKKRKDTRPKGVWRGNHKANRPSYEGQQYAGGRVEGSKNLKKIDGGVVNQHGVMFTNEEKKALERAANNANRKRKRQLEQEGQLPRKVAGNKHRDQYKQYQRHEEPGRKQGFRQCLEKSALMLHRMGGREILSGITAVDIPCLKTQQNRCQQGEEAYDNGK